MININELTTDHKIKLKKPMGCFDNLGEVCEIVKIDTDEMLSILDLGQMERILV